MSLYRWFTKLQGQEMTTPQLNWVTDVLLDVERALENKASARTLAALQHARAVAAEELAAPQPINTGPYLRLAVDNSEPSQI
jgi:hypothetical protein